MNQATFSPSHINYLLDNFAIEGTEIQREERIQSLKKLAAFSTKDTDPYISVVLQGPSMNHY